MPLVDEQRFLNQLTAEIVRPAFLAVGTIYLGVALAARWLERSGPMEFWLVHLAIAGVVLACWAVQKIRDVSPGSAHAWLFVLVVAISAVNAFELTTLNDPSHATYLMLTAFAAGYGFLSVRWFVGALGVLASAWLPAVLVNWPLAVEWREWSMRFAMGLLVAAVVFVTRLNSVKRQEALRRRAEERESVAAEALEAANSANEQRLRMQSLMQDAQRRESLGILVGGIAHDFNNLVLVISGNIELAREKLDPDSELHEYLADADAAARNAASLTRQMLTYVGRAKPNVSTVDIGSRLVGVVRLLTSSLPSHTRIRTLGNDEGPAVLADGALLDQVLMNLIRNAIDACSHHGGTIEVDWGIEDLDRAALQAWDFAPACQPGRYAVVTVRDDGCGMTDSVRQRIFEPFYTTKSGGSGLGLAAAQGIAEAHGAALAVESAPGKGSCFRFILPQALKVTGEHEIGASSGPKEGEDAILIVDDHPAIRRTIRSFLEQSGYTVLDAASEAEALKRIKQANSVQAALVDLTMPEQNGYEVAATLRARYPELLILIMSGYDRDQVAASRPGGEHYGYISKPFTVDELEQALHEARASTGMEPIEGCQQAATDAPLTVQQTHRPGH